MSHFLVIAVFFITAAIGSQLDVRVELLLIILAILSRRIGPA
jgi:hypothetical protein